MTEQCHLCGSDAEPGSPPLCEQCLALPDEDDGSGRETYRCGCWLQYAGNSLYAFCREHHLIFARRGARLDGGGAAGQAGPP